MGQARREASALFSRSGLEFRHENVLDSIHHRCYPKTLKKRFPISSYQFTALTATQAHAVETFPESNFLLSGKRIWLTLKIAIQGQLGGGA